MSDTLAQLAEEVMRREMAAHPAEYRPARAESESWTREMRPVPSGVLSTVAGVADAASTYYFLKRGRGTETNALMAGAGDRPLVAGLGALGGLAASKGIVAALRKVSPKAAEAVEANLGNLQLQYALGNTAGWTKGLGSSGDYQRRMQDLATRKK